MIFAGISSDATGMPPFRGILNSMGLSSNTGNAEMEAGLDESDAETSDGFGGDGSTPKAKEETQTTA